MCYIAVQNFRWGLQQVVADVQKLHAAVVAVHKLAEWEERFSVVCGPGQT